MHTSMWSANSNDAKFCSGCGVRLLNTPNPIRLPQQNAKLSPLRHLWLNVFICNISHHDYWCIPLSGD